MNTLTFSTGLIKEVQEWAYVFFVKFIKGRPMFVSKKNNEVKNMTTTTTYGEGLLIEANISLDNYFLKCGAQKVSRNLFFFTESNWKQACNDAEKGSFGAKDWYATAEKHGGNMDMDFTADDIDHPFHILDVDDLEMKMMMLYDCKKAMKEIANIIKLIKNGDMVLVEY